MSTDPKIAAVEAKMFDALAEDLKVMWDEDFTVLSYIVVAEVMHDDGTVGTTWSYTAGVPEYRQWGMLEWLRRRFEHRSS